MKTTFNKYM